MNSQLNILLDAHPLTPPRSGVGRYTAGMAQALMTREDINLEAVYQQRVLSGVELGHLVADEIATGTPAQQKTRYMTTLKTGLRGIARKTAPDAARRVLRRYRDYQFTRLTRSLGQTHIHHAPNFLPMPFEGPVVITVHDLSCFDHPEYHPNDRVAEMQRLLPKALARADSVICVSSATRQALLRWFPENANKAVVIPPGIDSPFFQTQNIANTRQVLRPYQLDYNGYFLCVGTLEPRKNLPVLFRAYAQLSPELRATLPLVVAGSEGWLTGEVHAAAQQLKKRGELRFLGFVPDADLPALYHGALGMCYPSRYEGFGLPVAEAMACGTPVIAGNRTSLPEVVGDAGLLVDPDDIDGFANYLHALATDKQMRDRLSETGRQHSEQFSWGGCAERLAGLYASLR